MEKGRKTNITGTQLEKAVQTVLDKKGFEIEMYRKWEKNPDKYGKEVLLKNVPFETIYGHKGDSGTEIDKKRYQFLPFQIDFSSTKPQRGDLSVELNKMHHLAP